MVAEIIVDVLNSNVDRVYDYAIPSHFRVQKGCRVNVNFAGRKVPGIVFSVKENSSVKNLKDISEVLDDEPMIGKEMFALADLLKRENHMLYADIFRLFLPSELRRQSVRIKAAESLSLTGGRIDLRAGAAVQNEIVEFMRAADGSVLKPKLCEKFSRSAVDALIKKGILLPSSEEVIRTPYGGMELSDSVHALTKEQENAVVAITEGDFKKYLLHGVTGSGKTEVYMRSISNCVAKGKTAIMLVPEIALTPQMLKNFRSRFGDTVAILHSGLSAGEKYDEWRRLKDGRAKIAVGARSAVFAPLDNLGMIIIDEEHEQSYIPDSGKFTTLEVAEFRCDYHGATLLLGSATPSVCTYYKAVCGEYRLISLSQRVNRKPLPKFEIVDMRKEVRAGNATCFSGVLQSELKTCLERGNQAMFFINRRGFSSTVLCSECGYVATCSECDVSLTYHREENLLKCHYCDSRFKMPSVCPKCGSEYIRQKGTGTERAAYELAKMFPNARILRMDNDTTKNKEGHYKITKAFSRHEADILVGTQMIAKGHDFGDVSLVGILDADLGLYFSDYRSVERTFQLITQMAGRAGRADVEGKVILQTHTPKHYVYNIAARHDYKDFYEREIDLRKATHYPPFAVIVRILFVSEKEESAVENLRTVYEKIKGLQKARGEDFIYLNRMKSPIKRLQNKFRYQILMRLTPEAGLKIMPEIYRIADENRRSDTAIYVENDPANIS